MKHLLASLLLCIVISVGSGGCTPPEKRAVFVNVVVDHSVVSKETCDSLVKEIDERIAAGGLSAVELENLTNVRERLMYIETSAQAMKEYLLTNGSSVELLAAIVKQRISSSTGNK